jgi:spermidine synthase
MLPWRVLGTAIVPGGEEMRLYQRGAEFSIRVGAYELMNSRLHASEDAFGATVCERLSERRQPAILIGGLGMSFTLAEVLRMTGSGAAIEVAELVGEVIEWNRGPLAHLTNDATSDPRVRIQHVDVRLLINASVAKWDAILLDVDNGPAALTSPANESLYSPAGLRAAARALKPEGLLGVWSSGSDRSFLARFERAGFAVEELGVRGHEKSKGPRYVIWIGRRANRSQ